MALTSWVTGRKFTFLSHEFTTMMASLIKLNDGPCGAFARRASRSLSSYLISNRSMRSLPVDLELNLEDFYRKETSLQLVETMLFLFHW